MNKRIKKLWIAALRSGKYKQAYAAMRTKANTYCCLGVLCDLYAKEKKRRWKLDGPDYKIDGAAYFLPESVMKWAGINDERVPIPRSKPATVLNDDGKSFNYIADKIEKYL